MASARSETPSARSLTIDVPGWPGNLAGQHLDLRLTAPDGYQAIRSYSIASAGSGERIQLAVDELPDGEVSPYLVQDVQPGDQIELRGPLGGWFVWKPEHTEPVLLIAGGSGVVPLVSMVRAHAAARSEAPFRLLYSVRRPSDVFFAPELTEFSRDSHLEVVWAYTREAPEGWTTPPGRVDRELLESVVFPPSDNPTIFVCGPTGFVETVATILVELGFPPERVKTERFGGT